MRYFIEEAKVGIAAGDAVIVSVKYYTDENRDSRWLLNSMITSIPCFYLFEKDEFDNFMNENNDTDDEWVAYIQEHYIEEFHGVPLGDDLQNTIDYIKQHRNEPATQIIDYIAALSLLDRQETDSLIRNSVGKFVDEITIPSFQ